MSGDQLAWNRWPAQGPDPKQKDHMPTGKENHGSHFLSNKQQKRTRDFQTIRTEPSKVQSWTFWTFQFNMVFN